MKPDILYKIHDNDDCDKLQNIVRYLYAMDIADIRPKTIIERNFPLNITQLPTIHIFGFTIFGLQNITSYYEKLLNQTNLLVKSTEFANLNPNYRINQKYTHKQIISK